MWKKAVVLALVVLTVLVATAPAIAEGPEQGPQRRHRYRHAFALAGTITAKGADTITVQVCRGNRPVSPHVGQELEIRVGRCRFWQWTPDGRVAIRFGAVEVRDTAVVRGVVIDDAFIARGIVVDVPFECSSN